MEQKTKTIHSYRGAILLTIWLTLAAGGYFFVLPQLVSSAPGTEDTYSGERESLRIAANLPAIQFLLQDMKNAEWNPEAVENGVARLGAVQGTLEGVAASAGRGAGLAIFYGTGDLLVGTQSMVPNLTSGRDFFLKALFNAPEGNIVEGTFGERYFIATPVVVDEQKLGWLVMASSPLPQAMAEEDLADGFGLLQAAYVIGALGLTFLFILIWRQADTARAKQDAVFYRGVATRIERQERLLQHVMNVMPLGLFILDMQNRLRYANHIFSNRVRHTAVQLSGKPLSAIFPAAEAEHFAETARNAADSGEMQSQIINRTDATGQQVLTLTSCVALKGLPVADADDEGGVDGVLIIEQDMTDAAQERERRQALQEKLLDTLLTVVDGRDPFAAHHSRKVGQLSKELAEKMDLDGKLVETAELAGRLMNVGKINIPEALLTQKSELEGEDLARIRNAIQASADFLEGIPFDGPVAETLRQSQEHVDGTGPRGLKGQNILITARIVAVANAFIAMASPRAYRFPLSIDDVIGKLKEESGKQFDQQVVSVLDAYLHQDGGREAWGGKLGTQIIVE